jgi:hypothetical protein
MADNDQEVLSKALIENEKDLLENSFKDEPVKEQPEKEPEPKAAEPTRDETGKFATKETKADKPIVEGEPKPDAAKVETDDKDGHVPSWRLREVADARRAAETERDTLRSQLAQLNGRLQSLERPKDEPKQEDIDPLLDPQGFAKRIESTFNARLTEERLNNNLALAHVRHGDKFEKAYNALLTTAQAGNRQIVPQITSQANPGEAIVRWYSDQETLKEVGSDPAKYKQTLLDEALKNPEFLAKAIEAAKVSAGQPKQNTITRLPPSLSRTTGSSSNDDAGDGEISVEALLASR